MQTVADKRVAEVPTGSQFDGETRRLILLITKLLMRYRKTGRPKRSSIPLAVGVLCTASVGHSVLRQTCEGKFPVPHYPSAVGLCHIFHRHHCLSCRVCLHCSFCLLCSPKTKTTSTFHRISSSFPHGLIPQRETPW